MAKGDIVAKLVLNSKDFDGKLAKSKKEIDSMKGMGSKVFGGMTTALKGFAVAAGAAVTVSEAFKAVIGSSQGLTDAWGRSLEATKTAFDNFVYSMANADFSSFNDGLSAMIDRAKEAYNAMDQLANTKMSANFVTTLDQSKYREAMSRARNKNLTREEREAALQEARGYLGTIQEAGAKLSADSEKALKAKFAAKLGIGEEHITAQMIEDAFRVDARFSSDEERARTNAEYKRFKDQMTDARVYGQSWWGLNALYNPEYAKKLQDSAIEQYKGSAVKYLALERLSDKDLEADMQLYLQSVNAKNAAAEMTTSINEVGVSIANEAKAASAKLKAVAASPATHREVPMSMATIPGVETSTSLPKTIEAKQMKHSSIDDMIAKGKTDARLFEYDIKQMELAQKGAENLSAAFEQVGASIGGAAGKMLNFAGSIADAIATMAPFLAYLQAEQVQRKAVANAAMEQAAASAMASTAGIPFAGVALGAAAVASIIGVMKSLPMLAEGGVVTGPTVAMIGEAGKEAVIPLDKLNDFVDVAPREVRVRGEIKASGKDLVVTIDNYNKVRRVK